MFNNFPIRGHIVVQPSLRLSTQEKVGGRLLPTYFCVASWFNYFFELR